MADEKGKKEKKDAPKTTHPITPIVVLLIVLLLLSGLVVRISSIISSHATFSLFLEQLKFFFQGKTSFASVIDVFGSDLLSNLVFFTKILLYGISIVFIYFIYYSLKNYGIANAKLKSWLYPSREMAKTIAGEQVVPRYINPKWQKVEEHINSENPADWKVAILEADIMLDEMLDRMGYHGATIGERLKNVEPADFDSLDSAWEAHKIRNSIAHEGSDFVINEREAKRVIRLFEVVFREFKFI